jgi:hypothetical protein
MFKKLAIFASVFAATITITEIAAQTPTTTSASAYDISCINRGNFAIGTRIGFSANRASVEVSGNQGSISTGTQTSTQLNFTPSIGYFFADRFMVGIGMDYLSVASKDNSTTSTAAGKSSDSRILFGPQLRYYLPIGNDQAFFLGAVSGFGTSNTNVEVLGKTQTVRTNIQSYGFGPGYTIFSSKCLAMEAQAKYNFGTTKSTVTVGELQQNTNSRINAFDFVVGINYYFGR